MFLSDFSIRRPVATIVLIIALMAMGVLALSKLRVNEIPGRQLLHVTFGSVLTQGKRQNGQSFKDAILDILGNDPVWLNRWPLDRYVLSHVRIAIGDSPIGYVLPVGTEANLPHRLNQIPTATAKIQNGVIHRNATMLNHPPGHGYG